MPMPGNQQVAALPRAAVGTRIIMRPGEDGGVITQSEYLIAELASQEKLRKKCTNKFIALLRRKDFQGEGGVKWSTEECQAFHCSKQHSVAGQESGRPERI